MGFTGRFNRISKGCFAFLVMASSSIWSMQTDKIDKGPPKSLLTKSSMVHDDSTHSPEKTKKKKKSSKNSSLQQSIIHLSQYPLEETLPEIEKYIQQVIQEKREKPLIVNVALENNKPAVLEFHNSFSKLVEKYPFPFSWCKINKGPDNQINNPAWIIELQLSSRARARELVEKEFAYHYSDADTKKINWPIIYDLAMSSGFSVEDFKFNNSLKIRFLELQGEDEEKDLKEVQVFLEETIAKNTNPFHIVSIKINNTLGLEPIQFFDACSQKTAHLDIRGRIHDPENGYLYLCLNNTQRNTLDLHGKLTPKGFEGRNVQQARKDILAFIIQAYETFQDKVTVLTGRGNHINPNGTSGVLYKGFKEWIEDESVSHIVKSHFPVGGDGGYTVILRKLQKLRLNHQQIKETAAPIIKIIPQMLQRKQSRLLLQTKPILHNQEYELIMNLVESLALQNSALFASISPFSFEAKPGVIRLILNHPHPRYPSTMCLGNCFGTPIHEGTIRYNDQYLFNQNGLVKTSSAIHQVKEEPSTPRDDSITQIVTIHNNPSLPLNPQENPQEIGEQGHHLNKNHLQGENSESLHDMLYSFGTNVALPAFVGICIYYTFFARQH